MPPFQNSEAIRPAVGFPGMMADMSEWNATTGFIVGTTLQPGFPVQYSGEDRAFEILTDGAFAGILRDEITNATINVAGDAKIYEENTRAGAVDLGQMYVKAVAEATRGGQAFWDATLGGWADTGTGRIAVPGVEFVTGGVADDVVIVKISKQPGTATPAPAA